MNISGLSKTEIDIFVVRTVLLRVLQGSTILLKSHNHSKPERNSKITILFNSKNSANQACQNVINALKCSCITLQIFEISNISITLQFGP